MNATPIPCAEHKATSLPFFLVYEPPCSARPYSLFLQEKIAREHAASLTVLTNSDFWPLFQVELVWESCPWRASTAEHPHEDT